jgi:hypothetical protein
MRCIMAPAPAGSGGGRLASEWFRVPRSAFRVGRPAGSWRARNVERGTSQRHRSARRRSSV